MGEIRLCDVKAASAASDGTFPPPTGASSAVEQLLSMYRRMVLIRRYEDHLYRLFLQGESRARCTSARGKRRWPSALFGFAPRRRDLQHASPCRSSVRQGPRSRRSPRKSGAKLPAVPAARAGKCTCQDVSVGRHALKRHRRRQRPDCHGAAIGFRLRGLDRVAVSFFGDGAANIGAFHEGINLAAVQGAPVVFVCENNLYAASTHISQSRRDRRSADRAAGYGIPGESSTAWTCSPFTVAAAGGRSRRAAGDGPTFLEYKTYRYPGHSRGDPGNYRPKEEWNIGGAAIRSIVAAPCSMMNSTSRERSSKPSTAMPGRGRRGRPVRT